VSSHWGVIKHAIEESLPPIAGGASDRMNNILESILIGTTDCWVSHNDNGTIDGLLLTRFVEDDCSKTRNLLIYCVYGFLQRSAKLAWLEGLKSLYKYAFSKNCHRIIGYTDVDSIIKFVKRVGGEAKYTFVSIPVGGRDESL